MARLFTSRLFFWALCAGILFARPVSGGTYIIPIASQLDRGWYNSAGDAAPTNTTFGVGGNYTAGMTGAEVRNFFIFKIPELSEPVVRADLVLYVTAPEDGGYASADPTETFVLYALEDFPVEVLRRRDTNEASVAIFEDLGNGVTYSDPFLFTATNQNSEVTIALNTNFLAAVTNNLGGTVALGGRVTSLRGYPEVMEFLFGYSHHVPFERTYLVLKTPAVARLEITRNVDGTLTLAFPVEFADYVLESSDDFLSWNPVVAPRDEDLVMIYVTVNDTTPTQQYFRLRAPL